MAVPVTCADYVFTASVLRNELVPDKFERSCSSRSSWKVDGERMVLTWKIKARKWHDGTPVTCGLGFPPESDCAGLYTSNHIPSEANSWVGQDFPGYRNPEMDRLCSSASREVDPDRRRALLQESTRLFARDLAVLPLYFRVAIVAVKTGLQNSARASAGALEAWNAHTWYWR